MLHYSKYKSRINQQQYWYQDQDWDWLGYIYIIIYCSIWIDMSQQRYRWFLLGPLWWVEMGGGSGCLWKVDRKITTKKKKKKLFTDGTYQWLPISSVFRQYLGYDGFLIKQKLLEGEATLKNDGFSRRKKPLVFKLTNGRRTACLHR